MIAEIIGPSGRVHYRRPVDDPLIAEALRTPGYSVRYVETLEFTVGIPGRMGRFGHHPDPDIDFDIECDCLLGLADDVEHGMADKAAVIKRMAKALEFRVGGILSRINAKEALRERFNELNFG